MGGAVQNAALSPRARSFSRSHPRGRGPATRTRSKQEEARWKVKEWKKCAASPAYFIHTYCYLLDKSPSVRTWVPFRLWPYQKQSLEVRLKHPLTIHLKSRQIGETWLELGFDLHGMMFKSVFTVLAWSLGLRESKLLTSRISGMYQRLPGWMQCRDFQATGERLSLSNGSEFWSLPSTAGDSFTASRALIDECDLIDNQESLLESAAPTFADGGSGALISKVNKDNPDTAFKAIWHDSQENPESPWHGFFTPWHARPDRDEAWYERERRKSIAAGMGLDLLHANYPATPREALSVRSQNKALPTEWLNAIDHERAPLPLPVEAPAIPELRVHVPPQRGRQYVIGSDVAEGLPGQDDSASAVLDKITGEHVAHFAGEWEPKHEYGPIIAQVARYYNDASILVERNTIGVAVIGWLQEHEPDLGLLCGEDGEAGWRTTTSSKKVLYRDYRSETKGAFDGTNPGFKVYDKRALDQLAAVDKDSLSHPDKKSKTKVDDEAMACVLGNKARSLSSSLWSSSFLDIGGL